MERLPILVIGARGQVGIELLLLGDDMVAAGTPLDITRPETVAAELASRRFGAVINVAAYTAVDRAESDVVRAWSANALGPAIIAAETARLGIPVVHVSTDFVFAGDKGKPYDEDDRVAPLNIYGASKEGGEQAVRCGNPRSAIVRTAWIVSPHRANFLKSILAAARERPALRVVDDQVGCPTSAADLAVALARIARVMAVDAQAPAGTWHFVNAGEASWHELAGHVIATARLDHPRPAIVAIPSTSYPAAARRPADSRLATAAITRAWGITPRHWRSAIDEILVTMTPAPVGGSIVRNEMAK